VVGSIIPPRVVGIFIPVIGGNLSPGMGVDVVGGIVNFVEG